MIVISLLVLIFVIFVFSKNKNCFPLSRLSRDPSFSRELDQQLAAINVQTGKAVLAIIRKNIPFARSHSLVNFATGEAHFL